MIARDMVLLSGGGRSLEGLASALRQRGVRVVLVAGPEETLEEMALQRPSTVAIDGVEQPWTSSLLVVAADRVAEWGGALIVLAPDSDPVRARTWIEAGAADVLCPPHSAAALLYRRQIVRTLAEREPARQPLPRRITLGDLTIDLSSRQITQGDRPGYLSQREAELLTHLLRAGGQVVRRETLIDEIWGEDQGNDSVLEATVHRLRRKLDGDDVDRETVTTVRGIGYRINPRHRPEPIALGS